MQCGRFWGWFGRGLFCQPEDGIRDLTVTGVQTCALPIFAAAVRAQRNGDSVAGPEHWIGPPREAVAADHVEGERSLPPRPDLSVCAEADLAQSRVHHRSEEHTSELQSQSNLVCRLLLEKK